MSKIILASQSPRRKQLMEAAELTFEVVVADVDETNPIGMPGTDVPVFLAIKKANAIAANYADSLIIAADTIVLLEGEILGKPKDEHQAMEMLKKLSGNVHEVVTGVCMKQGSKEISFSVITRVFFRLLSIPQISHYVAHYCPFDKAGAYAIQEWIGMVGIEKIEGDYYNVMGLPIGEVVQRLPDFK
ncbi:MAG: septum formation protein Maf [Bacteroidetes bacterium]|nr:septum formation protein Maf [Bacteroidota bacterium]